VEKRRTMWWCFTVWTLFGCGAAASGLRSSGDAGDGVRRVSLLGEHTFPEGIAADGGSGELFVGSLAEGEIQRVSARGVELFKRTHEDGLLNVIGLAVDAPRHRLWVCSSSFADTSIPPALIVFDTRSAAKLAAFTLPADGQPHFLNDVDVDSRGDAFATDSLAPVIWRVAADLTTLEPWLRDQAFTLDPSGFNLNGLAITPDDHWLVASVPSMSDAGQGKLFRVGIADRSVQEIALDPQFAGADGLVVVDDRRMIASGGVPGLFWLEFAEDFTSAKVRPIERFASKLKQPTTSAIAADRLWVVNSQLDHYLVAVFGERGPAALPFEILGIPLEAL
jgi:sugar lactone lactonase YvrE